jgi:hypothetical protein
VTIYRSGAEDTFGAILIAGRSEVTGSKGVSRFEQPAIPKIIVNQKYNVFLIDRFEHCDPQINDLNISNRLY